MRSNLLEKVQELCPTILAELILDWILAALATQITTTLRVDESFDHSFVNTERGFKNQITM
ncbi:hypothetical protein LF1_14590 [Rubripirellula obstinata]|uniref:Uncharacterized protein n=1 Tax=Rubripirellula obstinata TaxID=406547 RepID=A0A5B1CG78_9BACT|nr:hypothetical protein LF1_14590 [Rubripirellula obstinata]